MLFQEHVSLEKHNTLGLKAQARYYARISDAQQLQHLLLDSQYKMLPRLVLGGGSNVLFIKDFEGIVLHMAIERITILKEDQAHVWVEAGAGVSWHALVLYCIQQDYAGIENLSLIPGTVGAAPVQNIGAYGVELSEVFESLEAMEVRSGSVHTFSKKDCAFGYRNSIFKHKFREQYIILSVTLRLHKKPIFKTTYGDIQNMLKTMGVQTLSIQAISAAITRIRQSKLPDPMHLGNAGSFFKNPIITQQQFVQLQCTYPDIPGHVQDEGYVKVAAAWLIEQCGWKGKKRGSIGVHPQHALVLVNYGGGTGQGIYQLAQDIRQSVRETFGITLVPEVQIVS